MMSKYKIGDKVVGEVCDTGYGYTLFDYGNSEPLSTYTEPLEAKIRRQAAEITRLLAENKELKEDKAVLNAKIDAYKLYGDQHEEEYNQAFNQGAETAWELARKIAVIPKDGGYGGSKLIEIFNTALNDEIFNLAYSEAAAKVEAWEKATIKRGDEVEKNDLRDARFIVTFTNGKLMSGVTQSGLVFSNEKTKDWHKTGRHIDIDSFLKQIREK